MNIHHRINARKLLLAYLYQYCFLQKVQADIKHANTDPQRSIKAENEPFFDQHFLTDLEQLREKSSKEGEHFQHTLQTMLEQDNAEEIPYYLRAFFDQRKSEELDAEYLNLMIQAFPHFSETIKDLVNTHTDSFPYEQMEVCNQALFLLGYTEYQVIHSPKAVIINEMVELAKRYADEGAPKVLHAIFDKILA